MKKILAILLLSVILLSLIGFTIAEENSEWFYHAYDRVTGSNMEVIEFEDELGIIDSLVYNEMIKRSRNNFKADITFAEGEEDESMVVDKFRFDGGIYFDDRSKVKYELENFEVEWTDVQEDNYAELGGQAVLTYKATLVIEKEIPVEVFANFYQDPEDRKYQENSIEIYGEDVSLIFEGGKFKHRNKCYIGCLF